MSPILLRGAMRFSVFLRIFPILFCCFGCRAPQNTCDVLVSIPPYVYFVDRLTDGELRVESLVPGGANPHLYEPSPKQVASAEEAKLWIRLNENFEEKIVRILEAKNKNLLIVNLTEQLLPFLSGSTSQCPHCAKHSKLQHIDLHFWLSPRLGKEQARIIASALCKSFPERSAQIKKNLTLFEKELDNTDTLLKEELAPYQDQIVIVSHAAFGYFCKDYNLQQLAIEQEGKDPLPEQIASLLQRAKNEPVRAILIQAQYNNKGAIIIADMLHLPTRNVDPYSADYINNLLYIGKCITEP